MKRILLLLALVATSIFAQAAYLENVPTTLIQPNGDTLFCLQTGDEFYHRLHDDFGFTIIQCPKTHFFVYAQRGADGLLVSSGVVAHSFPQPRRLKEMGIEPGLMPPAGELRARAKGFAIPKEMQKPQAKTGARNRGTLNNLVIFIRFADEAGMGCQFSDVEPMFNDSSANATSQYAYFRQASYGHLSILSHFYPEPQGNRVLSYQDSMPRAYFAPYDEVTNPIGYTDRYDGRERDMLERCINWLEANHLVPADLDLDLDNDGYIDNIVFVLSGTYTGWSDILWPHKWAIYDRYVYLNGLRAYTFNLQLAGSGSHYFSSSTLCHEMFHTLGAPDLYRYYDESGVSTAGTWDLMHNNTTPPQHMSAWMKYAYGNWLDSIQEISQPGTYTLRSLADTSAADSLPRVLAIPTSHPHQYWLLEYRRTADRFEGTLPGSGLLIWRTDTRYDGNASFDTVEYLDGHYLMRPGGTDMVTPGEVYLAHFGAHEGRPAFSPQTDPAPWINPDWPCPDCFGNPDTTLSISDIHISADGRTLTFTVARMPSLPEPPDTLWRTLAVEVLSHPEHGGWGTVEGSGIYPDGTEVTLTAIPASGCALWYWDDGTCDETRVVTLQSDTLLTATFGPMCLGIDPADGFQILVQDRAILLQGAEGQPVELRDILGRLVAHLPAYDGHPLRLPHAGVYLLRVGDHPAQKVVIR